MADDRLAAAAQAAAEGFAAELAQFVALPSVSALPEHRGDVARAAQFVADRLRQAGMPEVTVWATDGHPAVFAHRPAPPGAPRVLVYGHFDVQPPDPLDRWQTPPFAPEVRQGLMFGRGVSDDKGPLLIAIRAVGALLAAGGPPAVDLAFLVEGEEEVGSPHLPDLVAAHREALAADLVISADGGMWRADLPSLTLGAKGICGLEFTVSTAAHDLHSGRHGGGVPNALHVLAELVAGLHDAAGRVSVEGFYDRVVPPDTAERRQVASLPFDEAAYLRENGLGAVTGEAGYSTLERQWLRPTLDLNGMWGGFQGEGSKTVIPCEAHAKVSCRLVPDQSPEEVLDLLERHLERHCPPGAKLEVRRSPGRAQPYVLRRDHPAVQVAAAVLEQVLGSPPLFVRMGGTLPCAELFAQELGAPTLFFSFAVADERIHAPNEFFRLNRVAPGIRSWAELLRRLGADLRREGTRR
jgi:acetylornithine deacetylase/succinyl-diaminopimelate desuccinylase-like protein